MNKFFKRILPATILATCCTVSVFSMTACNEGKDYSEDIAKLQQQIEDLQTENNSLKDKVNNLTPGGTDYTEEIEKLQQQIEAQKKLIESLQNAVNTEPKIYKVGETFTYSYQGVEFFSITVLSRSEFKVKNINMSGGEPVNSYLRALCYNFDFESLRITNFSDEHIKKNVEHIERTSFSVGYDMVFLGFPSGEDGIIPYAIFDLTTSV